MEKYEEIFTEAFGKELKSLDNSMRAVALKKIRKIIKNPLAGKPLSGGVRRFSERFLNQRIIYELEGNKLTFVTVGNRDTVYRNLKYLL